LLKPTVTGVAAVTVEAKKRTIIAVANAQIASFFVFFISFHRCQARVFCEGGVNELAGVRIIILYCNCFKAAVAVFRNLQHVAAVDIKHPCAP
jgi:hypothetical protein